MSSLSDEAQSAAVPDLAVPAPPEQEEPTAPGEQYPRIVSALRHHDFRLFWAGNCASNIGTWMQNVAQGWLVLLLTNSAFWLGVVGFAASIPMLLFTLFGGVIADRMSKRTLLLYTQSSMMILAFAMAALTYWKVINLWQISVLAFLTGTAMALNAPSYQALVPQLVPREDLANAIALNSAQFNLSRILGPTLGGFAMAWVGIAGNFLLNALSFLAVLFALVKIEYPEPPRREEVPLRETLREGFSYVRTHAQMRALIVLVAVLSFFAIPYITFVPLFARDILHVQERGLGILMACSGLGALLGAATIAWKSEMRSRGRVVALSGLAFFVSIAGFALSHWFMPAVAFQVMAGYFMILMLATVNTLMQMLSSDEMRGRVMSIYATALLGLPPLGGLITGWVADYISTPYAVALMAAAAFAWFGVYFFMTPALREMD